MPILFLIRHGETAYIGKRLQGCKPGIHLTQRGEEQAKEVAESLKHLKFKAIYSSPLERAMETAQPLASALQRPITSFDGIKEVNFGIWTGKSFRWLRAQPEWKKLYDDPKFQFPDGESLSGVRRRVVSAVKQIINAHKKQEQIALFTHSDVVRFAVEYYLGMPPGGFHRLVVSTASLAILRIVDDQITLLGFNLQLPYRIPDL
jgi:broad specificity phosphatase PhoE